MKLTRLFIISMGILLLSNCNPSTPKQNAEQTGSKSMEVNNQSNPAWVVNQIFEAAKSNNYEILLNLSFEGNYAKVKIKFGPNGNKDETMNLVKRADKWYLSSF